MSNVTFKRSPNVNSIPIVDGQLIFDETNNKIYMDNGEQRLQYGGDVSLISSVDYATANNAFSALATTQLFLNKNTVVDSKTDALAATEQGLPVGCLAFQSAIGQADYSSIDNTISACLLTINNKFIGQLKANNNDIYMDYHDGEYGINTSSTRGADTFIPFKQGTDFVVCSVTNFFISGSLQAYRGYGRLTYTDPDGIVTGGSADSNGSDVSVNFTTKTMTGTMAVGDGGCSLTVYARITGYYFVGGGTTSTHFQEGDKIAEWGSIAQPNTMWRIAFDKQVYT